MEAIPPKIDIFEVLNIPRGSHRLSAQQVYIELHPSNTGAIGKLSTAPVLVARELTVTVDPDPTYPIGARIKAEIAVRGIEVSSPDFSLSDREKIKLKIRSKLLESERFPSIVFQVQDVSVQPENGSILTRGSLTIHGRTNEQFVLFKKTGSGTYEANIVVKQTAFGLTPLTALMGGLRSEDRLAIRCVVRLGTA